MLDMLEEPTEPSAEDDHADGVDEPAFTSEIPASKLVQDVADQGARTLANASLAEFLSEARINVPSRGNRTLEQVIDRVNADDELKAWWHVANLNAVARLQMNDHSWVHMQIVTNIGLKLLRLLTRAQVKPSMVTDYAMNVRDSEVVVVLGLLLHDIGMSIHRSSHEEYSLFLADRKANELLNGLYDVGQRTAMVSEILQSIISHRAGGKPLTVEAGVVRVADALDMTNGRSRIPFEQGRVSIHALSAAAIEQVRIQQGTERPILVEIDMNNSSGVFQVDELLKSKLNGSGIEHYVEVIARVSEQEKRLVSVFRL
jgi:metal-dependent HD superfamily phosphatase/phosphodiesterase